MQRPLASVLLAFLLGCATPPKAKPDLVPMSPPPAAGPSEFSPKGDLLWKDLNGVNAPRRATFDDWRVKGPTVSIQRGPAGEWAGKVRGVPVTLVASEGKVKGGDVDLDITFGDKGVIVIEGRWGGKPVRLSLASDKIKGMIPGGPIELTDMGTGMFNSYAGLLQISGPPDMPQVAIALLDVLVL